MDDWRPDAKTTIRKNVFLWTVPAKVQGRWRAQIPLEGGDRKFEFDFLQHFQDFDGTVKIDGKRTQFWEPKLRGDRISFVVVDNTDRENEASLYFDGRVTGNAMEGMFSRGVGKERTSQKWRALRIDS